MPTPEWRHEKATYVIQSQCNLLATDLDEDQKREVTASMHNALKLVCDSIIAGAPDRADCWSPKLVELFVQQPEKCGEWLNLLDDTQFEPESYLQ